MKKPANHTICRLLILVDCQIVGALGFEPRTPWSQTRYTTGLCYTPNFFKTNTFVCTGKSNKPRTKFTLAVNDHCNTKRIHKKRASFDSLVVGALGL